MSIKSTLILQAARWTAKRVQRQAERATDHQAALLAKLLAVGKKTAYGQKLGLAEVRNYAAYRRQVPIADYEDLKPYMERIIAGEKDVLWRGRPRYFAKTSGTTSGVKYIPITSDSLPNHFGSARNALFCYLAETGNTGFLDGKMIFLSGSPELDHSSGIATGRLSGISNHLVPAWLKKNQLPSYTTNCIEDWEEKLDAIVEETHQADMRLISGIPPWVQMYYERLLAKTGKSTIKSIFPHLSMFVYGGVNFEPYRAALEGLVGERLPSVETYPASEGFIAYQDSQNEKGLLLNTHSSIFFEFVPLEEAHLDKPRRLWLGEVELGKTYALVLTSNAGLWAYDLGDTVEFVSLSPYRIIVSGRVKHFISAFGEHVIGKEVEYAFEQAAQVHGAHAIEFSVAPQVTPADGSAPYHEWFVEFEQPPHDMAAFAKTIDEALQEQNTYYYDLRVGNILRPAVITLLQRDAFRSYMAGIGKLGGQNKVPRLANDRKIADVLAAYRQT